MLTAHVISPGIVHAQGACEQTNTVSMIICVSPDEYVVWASDAEISLFSVVWHGILPFLLHRKQFLLADK